jgi:hypothetical protein
VKTLEALGTGKELLCKTPAAAKRVDRVLFNEIRKLLNNKKKNDL